MSSNIASSVILRLYANKVEKRQNKIKFARGTAYSKKEFQKAWNISSKSGHCVMSYFLAVIDPVTEYKE